MKPGGIYRFFELMKRMIYVNLEITLKAEIKLRKTSVRRNRSSSKAGETNSEDFICGAFCAAIKTQLSEPSHALIPFQT